MLRFCYQFMFNHLPEINNPKQKRNDYWENCHFIHEWNYEVIDRWCGVHVYSYLLLHHVWVGVITPVLVLQPTSFRSSFRSSIRSAGSSSLSSQASVSLIKAACLAPVAHWTLLGVRLILALHSGYLSLFLQVQSLALVLPALLGKYNLHDKRHYEVLNCDGK